jgi:hypothetical protein
MSHDGTDFNIAATNTTDINFTGITNLQVTGLAIPHWNTAGQTSGNVTISTSAASGGSNGDIHFKY